MSTVPAVLGPGKRSSKCFVLSDVFLRAVRPWVSAWMAQLEAKRSEAKRREAKMGKWRNEDKDRNYLKAKTVYKTFERTDHCLMSHCLVVFLAQGLPVTMKIHYFRHLALAWRVKEMKTWRKSEKKTPGEMDLSKWDSRGELRVRLSSPGLQMEEQRSCTCALNCCNVKLMTEAVLSLSHCTRLSGS